MDDLNAPATDRTWGQRNALTILLVVLGIMFVLVIVVQKLT
jgi:hypothetical protein